MPHSGRPLGAGQALLFVFFLLLSIGVVTVALAGLWRSEIQMRTLEREGLLAFYLAGAGLERAKAELAQDEGWAGDVGGSLGEGAYQIDPVQSIPCPPGPFETCKTIASTGTVRGATRRIAVGISLRDPAGNLDPQQLPETWNEE